MKSPRPPRFETRRAKELETELFARARAWIPDWGMDGDERDFGRALLKVAARFTSEVAERLDRAGEKLRLGFLDWLAVATGAARPARLPVVFKLADSASEAKPAIASTRLQAEAAGASVILETETEVLVLPRGLQLLVGVDGAADAFFLPPPGLSTLAPLEPLPTQWQLKSFASAGARTIQLDPEQGLAIDMVIELGGRQYSISKVNKDIVTLATPLSGDLAAQSVATKVTAFMPFDGAARNAQEHALYLGHMELFDIESAATIEILGAKPLTQMAWHYSGKRNPEDPVDWLELPLADETAQAKSTGIVLNKPKGKLEPLELTGGVESRWIRASVATVAADQPPLLVDTLEIRINCGAVAPVSADPTAAPSAEAMANTTPLVLDSVFFPFGKEPRQFDAFYIGSKEVFSKKGAIAQLDFAMADTTFSAMSVVRGGTSAGKVLAGVAQDGALYLLELNPVTGALGKFRDTGALRPPPTDGSADVSAGIPLDQKLKGRLPVWTDAADPNGFLVAVSTGDSVWVRRASSVGEDASKWIPFGSPPTTPANPEAKIADLAYLADSATLFSLRGGQLSSRPWPEAGPWVPIGTKDGSAAISLDTVVPVLIDSSGSLVPSSTAGLLGVSNDNKLYRVTAAGACTALDVADADAGVSPVAVIHGTDLLVTFMHTGTINPSMFHLSGGGGENEIKLDQPDARVIGFDATISGGALQFMATVQRASSGYLASWTAPATGDIEPFRSQIPAEVGQPVGTPAEIEGRIAVPGAGGHVLIATFDVSRRFQRRADVGEAVFMSGPVVFVAADFLARAKPGGNLSVVEVEATGTTDDGDAFYLLEEPFAAGAGGALYGFRAGEVRNGKFRDEDRIDLDDPEEVIDEGAYIKTDDDVAHLVTSVDLVMGVRVATVEPELTDPGGGGEMPYLDSVALTGRVAPYMHLDSANNDWSAALLDQATLRFPGASPVQRGKAFKSVEDRAEFIELLTPWTTAPASTNNTLFRLDAAAGTWAQSLADTATNPELSWEYWNGTGWWKLVITRDETANLKVSGKLEFKVPSDLAPTDWSGRTNYWIRARLIGGDYGRENVSVEIGPIDPVTKVQKQTIVRSTEDIHAPSVVKLGISYEICDSVLPTLVFTRDSGTLRNQSDANSTGGANVEAFVPLARLLGRLSGAPSARGDAVDCKADCNCPGVAVSKDDPQSVVTPAEGTAPASGRAIYLGCDAPLLGEPINILLLVDERPHDEFAPMNVEALIAGRFVPITVNDATRALGESGVLSLAFAIEPTPRELFGQTLSWLRLSPAAGPSSANWKPKILGAYLNGVWASAAESLTYELLGSSQGEPNLTLFLARPPVLRDSLVLRVSEPLGEEELAELQASGEDQVLTAVENLPGSWVLWQRVIDPADEDPLARVYALDEATGEIRFGDGRHGRIPPIGRDSIMAFSYRRTEPAAPDSDTVPGNAITARTPLNLVSPIDGVEAVFAADQAAGGAPPEDVDRVLRFGVANLRHRERALTAQDVEDLALESSPDIAQAHCFSRNGYVELVVVMRGANPVPNAAQVRELHRLIVAGAPPSLSAHQALRIGGPTLRSLRVDLRLTVASLDVAGSVARECRKKISALFDTAIGGVGGEGWALGDNPNESDIAVVLADVARLEGIDSVSLHEIAADGTELPWPLSLRRTELAQLVKDGVRIEFETVEVIA